jgi:lipoic acid synthetase
MDHQEPPHNPQPRLPGWLKKNRDLSALHHLKAKLRHSGLSTVCEEARCPNICECFQKPTATFLILGDVCTRCCSFCSVRKGTPAPVNRHEPSLVAQTAEEMGLEHVVITSVTRDDLPDKGAEVFTSTIRAIRDLIPACTIEILTPDFSGRQDLLEIVLGEKPDVFGHNVEMTARLYPAVRPCSSLTRSLDVLRDIKNISPETIVKSGFMVGLGESESEIKDLLGSLADVGCDIVTIGQYLRPTRLQMPVAHYWEPEFFTSWSNLAKSLGIGYCIAGPFVRSSYRAKEVLKDIRNSQHNMDKSD